MSQLPLPEWAAEVADAQFTDPALVKARATKFDRTIMRRNFIEYAAGALALVLFTGLTVGAFIKGEPLIAVASIVILIGVGIVMWQLHVRGSVLLPAPEEPCLQHLRGQYYRQYKALDSVWKWYLGPLVPGILAFYGVVAFRVSQAAGWQVALEGSWKPLAVTVGLFLFIGLANWFAARALKRKVDQIDALS